jgi:NTE family protein
MNHHRLRRRTSIGFLLAGLALLAAGVSRGEEAPRRLKVGLALGGGGARGFAHIGVLRELERLHIPIDYIAGTSMGSIIGGLYATGMSPDEMEKEIKKIDWLSLSSDSPPRQDQSYRRKQDDQIYLFGLSLGIKNGRITLPVGLIAGDKLSFLLRSMTIRAALEHDFDKLPIPFRTIATVVQTGDIYVFSKGNVADAIRASMSVPGVFAPVEYEGKVLTDGGTVQNLPVQTVRAMGADIVIAVDVGESGEIPEQPTTFAQVLSQNSDIASRRNVFESRKLADLVIQPDLKGFGFLDFSKPVAPVPRGEKAAREASEKLARWAVPEEQYETWRKKQRGTSLPPVKITAVEVDAGSIDPRRLAGRVRSQAGQPLDLAILQKDLERIHELDLFESVDFQLVPEGDGAKLKIVAKESARATDTLRLGLSLRTDFQGNSDFDFLAGLNLREMNRVGGEWKTEIIIGNTLGFGTEFYQPLSYGGPFFVAPRVFFSRQNADYFVNDEAIAQYRTQRFRGGVDLGMAIGKIGELRVGYDGGHLKFEKRIGSPVLPNAEADTGSILAKAIFDQLDTIGFAHSGYYGYVRYTGSRESLGATVPFDKLEGGVYLPKTFGPQTWALTAFGGDSLGTTLPVWELFSLGGFRRLSGLQPNELSGQTAAFTSLATYRRIGDLGMLGGIYLGASLETGNTWQRNEAVTFDSLRVAGSVFLGVDSLLGPFSFAYGIADRGNRSFTIFLGRTF